MVITNIQRSIDTENEVANKDQANKLKLTEEECQQSTGYTFLKYQRETTIRDYFKCLAKKHSDTAHYEQIGNSYQGRELFLIKIGNSSAHGPRKPAVWIDGGIHAREWISPATVAYITTELLHNAEQHADILNEFDFYIMPLINPDGYEYTHTNNR